MYMNVYLALLYSCVSVQVCREMLIIVLYISLLRFISNCKVLFFFFCVLIQNAEICFFTPETVLLVNGTKLDNFTYF